MRLITFLLVFSLCPVSWVIGEINTYITDYEPYVGKVPGRSARPFLGSFTVTHLPEPLKVCHVDYEFYVARDDWSFNDSDWTLQVRYPHNIVTIESDSLFHWPGPHKVGDVYKGGIDFIPLMSGEWTILIAMQRAGSQNINGYDLGFRWCLDEDGDIGYLGKPRLRGCTGTRVTYFEKDSVALRQYVPQSQEHLFTYNIVVSPIPKIGDTSTVYLHLTATRDIANGRDMEIGSMCMEVVKLPECIRNSINENQHIDLEIQIVPHAVNAVHKLSIDFYNPVATSLREKAITSQTIMCFFAFNIDSTLKYASLNGLSSIPKDKMPAVFRKRDYHLDLSRITIRTNGEIERKDYLRPWQR